MKILICGATGFLGRHLTEALQCAGHSVVRGIRKPSLPTDIAVDFSKDTDPETWLPRLIGMDAVINAVGVLRDSRAKPMVKLHEQTPLALFNACHKTGIKRIMQVSALGVNQGVETPYFKTRRAAETYLKQLPETIRWLILQPSIIYGEEGASAQMFRFQAEMPVHFLLAGGCQTIQPVHISDICSAVVNWFADVNTTCQTVACVGMDSTSLSGMLKSYRKQLGYQPAWPIPIPSCLLTLAAKVGDVIPYSPLCSDTLTMLNAGNTADSKVFTQLLGKPPRSYSTFLINEVGHVSR